MLGRETRILPRWSKKSEPWIDFLAFPWLLPFSSVPYMFTIVSVILRLFEVGKNLQWYLMEDGIGEIIGIWRSLHDLHVGRQLTASKTLHSIRILY